MKEARRDHSRFETPLTVIGVLSSLLLGCTGAVGSNSGPPATPGPTSSPLCSAAPPGSASVSPVRRLTREEVQHTLTDLIPAAAGAMPGSGLPALPADDQNDLGAGARSLIVSPAWLDGALKTAEDVAAATVASLPALLPCAAAAGDDACAQTFIRTFGKRAYRRPLTDDEVTRLTVVHAQGRAN